MTMKLRPIEPADAPFLREMLYEAVYWRSIATGTAPPMDEALADPDVRRAVDDLGDWDGDAAVVAVVRGKRAGAAWYRFWTDDNHIRGHIEEGIPALVIAVHRNYRRRGVGQKLIEWLLDHAAEQGVAKMSLMVSKDNHALRLYETCGFRHHADCGDSVLMLREVSRDRSRTG